MIVKLIGAFIFSFVQMQAMIEESTPESNYVETAAFVVGELVKDYNGANLLNFSEKFNKFTKMINVLKDKNILALEENKGLGVGKNDIYGLNGSLVGPCFAGLKYKIYTDARQVKEIELLQKVLEQDVFDFGNAIYKNRVWSESEKKYVDAVEISIKKERQLFSDDFYHEIYDKNNDEYASKWNYLGGHIIDGDYAKERIEKNENVTKKHLKFGNVLLIPGVSPITTQNLHSQLLAIATSCYLVQTVGLVGYKQLLNKRFRARFPKGNFGVENVSDLELVLKIHKKIAEDIKTVEQLNKDYRNNNGIKSLDFIGYNNTTFENLYTKFNESWDDECKEDFLDKAHHLAISPDQMNSDNDSFCFRRPQNIKPNYCD